MKSAPNRARTKVLAAGSVLLARSARADEVFLVKRSPKLRFLGGFYAFPGGKVDPTDLELSEHDTLEAQCYAAIRELFEEVGILLARGEDGTYLRSSDELRQSRRELLAGELSFEDILDRYALRVDRSDLRYAGSLVTPPFSPHRFDTAFYVGVTPEGQTPEVWPGELETGAWQSAEGALRAWERGELLLSPPTQALLETIRGKPIVQLPEHCQSVIEERNRHMPTILFHPAVQMIPLDSAGLPPTTHTNAYLVGTGPRYLIDPGPQKPEEQRILFEVLDGHLEAGRALSAIVLTHHHRDHIGAASVCAERYGAPILAHSITAKLLEGKVAIDRFLEDGEELDLGEAPHGRGRWRMRAMLTPGHAPGHLAFFEPEYGLLFAGDMVSTMSSVVIAPPEGDLSQYMESLRELQTLPIQLLLPAHGGPNTRALATLEQCLSHRLQREKQLADVLAEEPQDVQALTRAVYPELATELLPLAELQILAGLLKFQKEGRAEKGSEERWYWL